MEVSGCSQLSQLSQYSNPDNLIFHHNDVYPEKSAASFESPLEHAALKVEVENIVS
jgi:hypothetical protein